MLFAFLDVLRELLHEPAPASELDTIDEVIVDTQDWDDFAAIESLETDQVVNKNILAVRRGEVSPIGIKRPKPILEKMERTEAEDERNLSEGEERILGLVTGSISTEKRREVEATFLNTVPMCVNSNTASDVENAQQYYERQGITVGRWKPRNYRWERGEGGYRLLNGCRTLLHMRTSAKMLKDVMRWSRRAVIRIKVSARVVLFTRRVKRADIYRNLLCYGRNRSSYLIFLTSFWIVSMRCALML